MESAGLPWQEQSQARGELYSPLRSNRPTLNHLQNSQLDINSELIHDELNLKLNPSQQLNEYAKNSHNLYRALQQYDPELADSILQSSFMLPGQNNITPERLAEDDKSRSSFSIPFPMYEVSTQASSHGSHSSQII